MKEFIKDMLSAASGHVSSKRVIGVLIWLVIIAMYIHCTVSGAAMLDITDWLIIAASSLIGVDSVTGMFKK